MLNKKKNIAYIYVSAFMIFCMKNQCDILYIEFSLRFPVWYNHVGAVVNKEAARSSST